MGYTENNYLQESLNKKMQAIDSAMEKNKIEADKLLKDAQAVQKEAGRGASSDYLGYINPYGIQAESLAKNNLNDSGISQSDRARAYQSYQGRLASASSDYSSTQSDVYTDLLKAKIGADADKLSAQSGYYDDLYDDYWKNKNFEYKLERDAISDARYEAKNSGTSSSSKSSGSSSKSSSTSSSSVSSGAWTADPYQHADVTGVDYIYFGDSNDDTNYSVIYKEKIYKQEAMAQIAMIEAKELTGNGSHPASTAQAKEFIKYLYKEYKLSTEQINKIGWYLTDPVKYAF